uniref:CSON008071 protein n=1 Tax=Culicoides sonorensis TaxID=179676 RepID=A0A336LBB2_CULSO
MSISVIQPQYSSGLYKIKSKVILKSPKPGFSAARESIKKNLFGCADKEETKRFVKEELSRLQKQKEQQWGFDFVECRPLDNKTYQWQCVVPSTPITLTQAAHVINQAPFDSESTSSGELSDIESPNCLLDDRADRANNYREPAEHFCDSPEIPYLTKSSPVLVNPTAFKPIVVPTNEIVTRSKPSRRMSTPPKQQEKRQPKITDWHSIAILR